MTLKFHIVNIFLFAFQVITKIDNEIKYFMFPKNVFSAFNLPPNTQVVSFI